MKKSLGKKSKLWVIKVGSATYMSGGPLFVRAWMNQVKTLKESLGISVIWVTSGAISSARGRVQRNWKRLDEKQALSAIGQPLLMDQYNLALQNLGWLGAQVLLSYGDFRQKTNRENLKNTLNTLLKWSVVPILNENDAVSTEEIRFGDNDTLSAKVACLMKADRLVILSNVNGYYNEGSNFSAESLPVPHIPSVNARLLARVQRERKSEIGTGGMYSKLKAAQLAQKQGIETWLINGDLHQGLLRIARNESVGTRIGGSSK